MAAFICLLVGTPSFGVYDEDLQKCFPVRFIVEGTQYKLGVFASRQHLLGVDPPARLLLMGTDSYGRDLFSRLLYGGQISLLQGCWRGSVSGLGMLLE